MPFTTIVVGTDGSDCADAAVNAALEIVPPDGTVHLVAAFDPPSDSEVGRFIASLPREFRDSHDPTGRSQEVVRKVSAQVTAAGIRCIDHLVDDEAAAAILDVADKVNADLIVVGCRGLGAAERFRRGSVSDRVNGQATRSVLVVQ